MQKNIGIILAAGRGSRMNSDIPKQFLKIDNKDVFIYSLQSFSDAGIDEIILIISEEYEEYVNETLKEYSLFNIHIVYGGSERYYSVFNALDYIDKSGIECKYILIHDAARPVIKSEIIKEMTNKANDENIASLIPGVKVKDTIRDMALINKKEISVIDRNNLVSIQTPQIFKYDILYNSYKKLFQEYKNRIEELNITDDAMVVELISGISPYIYHGDEKNIKITTPEDLIIAKLYLKNNK